jgi:UDP-N-acetylmuramate: L-alanyl-gamma-D-glutamyl-meso-diaminopimelate ligase
MELHTFSSLKKEFLPHYRHTMDAADEAYVYFNPHTVEHKKLEPITPEMVFEGFGKTGLRVTTDSEALFTELVAKVWEDCNLLLMSSGNFDGKDLPAIARKITGENNGQNT